MDLEMNPTGAFPINFLIFSIKYNRRYRFLIMKYTIFFRKIEILSKIRKLFAKF